MNSPKLHILGKASGKTWEIDIDTNVDLDTVLWAYLEFKGHRLASSCLGLGICKKCTINNGLLACQLSLNDILKKGGQIEVDYW